MIRRTYLPVRRVLFPSLRRFSGGEIAEDNECADSADLTQQASLYVHVSWLIFFFFLQYSYAEINAYPRTDLYLLFSEVLLFLNANTMSCVEGLCFHHLLHSPVALLSEEVFLLQL